LVDRIIESLDVTVEPFALCEVGEGSDLTIGELGWVTLHFVLAGEGQIRLGHRKVFDLPKYSLCLVKQKHDLVGTAGDESDVDESSLDGVEHLFGTPSGDPDFVVACGRIQATYGLAIGLFDLIDDPLVVRFSESSELRHLFGMILKESSHPTPGSLGMIEAMMKQCLIILLRELSSTGPEGLIWVDALADERMAGVIESVLDRPEARHTVESLSATANMSRSAFASQFRRCFNQTPMSFVRTVRLRRAAGLLRTTGLTTAAVARRCGFASRSYFADAFKREYGVSPGEFRDPNTLDLVRV
jgi:AraC-like DNA-binding protein